MALLQDLIQQIDDPALRERILQETNKLLKQKKFGLVFEEHLPECTPLYDMPIRVGSKVALKTGYVSNIYTVMNIDGDEVQCDRRETHEQKIFKLDELVTVAEFGEPIYPTLKLIDTVENAPDSGLWHTLIEADNYHALQLLEYLYSEKVDCIYIDPPYNTRDKDWKYNNDYVDSNDAYKHSKWLSMMKKRLQIAKKLLNPVDSVLIVTIDEKEYLHLGCLLEELFTEARIQMVSISNNLAGVQRTTEFARTDEFAYFVMFGNSVPQRMVLGSEWVNAKSGGRTHLGFIRWDLLRRTGSNTQRSHSPGCYYPIYISDDGKRFCGTGEALPLELKKEDAPPSPEGTISLWPTRQDGSEGVWQLGPEKFNERVQKGLIKLGPFKGDRTCVYYLKPAEEAKLYDGTYEIIGYNEDGSVITSDAAKIERNVLPSTQWQVSAHDATHYGTRLIKKFIPGREFPYPKSLFAVHDTLMFYVANKPNALIVDFFAVSGTTLHAVNLLNAEDGGNRRCILVTNNEVSDAEAKLLSKQGYHPGDAEWERFGIAQYITWPRTVCSIKGHDINGKKLSGDYGVQIEDYVEDNTELFTENGKKYTQKRYKKVKTETMPKLAEMQKADGFASNCGYFKLTFLDKTSVALGRQFRELLPVLWMKGGAIGKCPALESDDLPEMLILPQNKMAVLVDEIYYSEFDAELSQHPEIQTVFIVTDSEIAYRSMIRTYDGKDCYQLYRDYLDNFRINTGR